MIHLLFNDFPGTRHADRVDISGSLRDGNILVKYKTNLDIPGQDHAETSGEGILRNPDARRPSNVLIVESINNWNAFKVHAAGRLPQQFIFRGQPCKNRLRTSFHRTRRSDPARYVTDDVPLVHRHLTPLTRHIFDLSKADQSGAFYNLMQHHAYPTPLLDWSFSPFIAAFFAYRSPPPNGEDKVRVYIFDRTLWMRHFPPYDRLTYLPLHLSVIIELLGIENQRMIPQQALSTVTNIDDIEDFIATKERELNVRFLYAIDLPVSERDTVLRDLSLMGITAASLFPGLDGSCEALKGRMFGY